MGSDSTRPVASPPIVAAVGRAAARSEVERGVVLGGSGRGERRERLGGSLGFASRQGGSVEGSQPHTPQSHQEDADDQDSGVRMSTGGDEAQHPGDEDSGELQRHDTIIGREQEVAKERRGVHGPENPADEEDVPSSASAATTGEFRFVAQGGLSAQARASLAGPFLVAGSRLVRMTAATGSRRAVHSVERALGRITERMAGIRLDMDGLEKVDPAGSYVVVALHEGFADALALLRLPLRLKFAARDELFDWPALGRYLRAGRHVRVDTDSSVTSVRHFYREAGRVLDGKDSLVVFTQGTILGVEIAFRQTPMRLARRFGRPVLPVVLTGSHRVWEHPYSSTLRLGATISVRVLDPIPPHDLDAATFRDLERHMKRVALGEGMAPARRFRPERDGWWDGYPFEIDPDFPELRARLIGHRQTAARSRRETATDPDRVGRSQGVRRYRD